MRERSRAARPRERKELLNELPIYLVKSGTSEEVEFIFLTAEEMK